jgi:hypothetical protein
MGFLGMLMCHLFYLKLPEKIRAQVVEKQKMEPAWAKDIKSETVCTYFYALFIAVCVIIGLQLVTMLGGAFSFKGTTLMKVFMFLLSLLPMALAIVNALFLYLICSRGLLKEEAPKQKME